MHAIGGKAARIIYRLSIALKPRIGVDAPSNLTALCKDCPTATAQVPLSWAPWRKVKFDQKKRAIIQRRYVHGDYEAGVLQQAKGRI
jgi:hypothetical protein